MTSWVATVSDRFPEHWEAAQRAGFWDTEKRRNPGPDRPALEPGDLVFFIGGGSRGQVLGMVRATTGQEPITDDVRPWSPHDTRDYKKRFRFEVLSNDPEIPTTRAEARERLSLDAGNQRAVRRITNEDGARWLRLRVEGQDVLFTEDVETLAASVEAEMAEAIDETTDSRERALVAIRLRQGQPAFRKSLLRAYDARCAVTGLGLPSLLEAAHIVSHVGAHTNRTDNGLLLRPTSTRCSTSTWSPWCWTTGTACAAPRISMARSTRRSTDANLPLSRASWVTVPTLITCGVTTRSAMVGSRPRAWVRDDDAMTERSAQADLDTLLSDMDRFTTERGWERFHDPKSLILALVGEVGELAELFQWVAAEEAVEVFSAPERRQRAAEEMSDVFIYLLRLAEVLDVDLVAAASAKLTAAGARYPARAGVDTPAPEKS